MQIREIMTRDLDKIESSATIQDAALRMQNEDIGALAVVEGGKISGIVTDRDIVVRGISKGLNPTSDSVGKVETDEMVYVSDSSDVSEAAETMRSKKIRRLLVRDDNDQPVGIISLGDIAGRAEEAKLSGEVLRDIFRA